MRIARGLLLCLFLLGRISVAAPKLHVVAFGKWTTVKWMVGEDERTVIDLKVRALLVDGQTKEFITGAPHDVTDRTFVVQRVFRLNDSLSQETAPERWPFTYRPVPWTQLWERTRKRSSGNYDPAGASSVANTARRTK